MLAHWLPLNGNINNQGLHGNWKSTNISYADGILGKAAHFTGDCTQKIWFENPNESQIFSWACWVYMDEVSTTRQMILSHGRDYLSYGFNITVEANATKACILYGGENYSNVARLINYELLGKWTHIAITADYENITVYINGEKNINYPKIPFDYSQATNAIVIGKMAYNHINTTTYCPFYGKICDVRIYDNCISAREVRDISNGLICHYPLSNPYETYYKNLYSSTYNCGSASVSGFTKTKSSDEDGVYYNYSCSHSSSETSDRWYSIYFPKYTFTAGKSYTISIKIRVHSCINMSLTLRHSRISNDFHGCKTQQVVLTSSEKNVWKEYYLTQVIPASHVYNGVTYVSDPLIEFYTGNLASLDCSMSFDLKDVQVVESDSYLPFISGSTDGIIYDASGFGNNGATTETTSPTWISNADSPKYNGNYLFNGSSSCITVSSKVNEIVRGGNSPLSYSFWFKPIDTGRNIIFGDYSTPGYINFNIEYDSNGIRWYWDASPSKYFKINIATGTWAHICLVYTGTAIKAYKDSVLVETYTITLSPKTKTSGNFLIGKDSRTGETMLNGYLSDFRIYTTALSEDEIKNLYHRRFSIDQEGALFCAGIEEDETISKISLKKTGILSAKEIEEPINLCRQISTSTSYTPNTGTNSTFYPFATYQDDLEPGDTATIELDVLWDGFDTSNADGTFNLYFQGALFNNNTGIWTVSNRYTAALNTAKNLKELVLNQANGMYHYIATTTALSAEQLSYERVNIGMRADYSNGKGTITIQNCYVYKTDNYIGKEKARFYSDRILCNNYIEN